MVQKLGKGKGWAARAYWYDETGKRCSKYKSGFRTKVAAEAWETNTIAAMTAPTDPKKKEVLTVQNLYDEYVKRLKLNGASPSTLANYKYHGSHYLPLVGNLPADEVTRMDVQRAVDAMRTREDGTDYRSETVRGSFRSLRAVLNYGVRMGVMASCPCAGIDLPPQQEHKTVIYSGEQLHMLLDALRNEMSPLYWPVSFSVRNALRRGEALGVRWCDIDFDDGLLYVRANLTCAIGSIQLKCVKTQSSQSTVALPADFLGELRDLQTSRRDLGQMVVGSPDINGVIPRGELDPREFVCLNEHAQLYRPDNLARMLQGFQKAHGLPVSSWHDLRHSYGTLMAEAGVDVVTISKAMRHASTTITANQYIKGTDQIKRNATQFMDQIVQSGTRKDMD